MIVLSIACVNSGADLRPLAEDGAVLNNLAGPCTCGCCTEFLRGSGRFLDGGALALERPGSPGTPGPGPRESSLAAKNTSKAMRPARLRHFGFGDRREITASSSRRARQARRVRGHQGRHQVHLRLSGRGPVLPHLASPPCPQGERQGGGPPPLTFDVASLRAKSHSASLPLSCAS